MAMNKDPITDTISSYGIISERPPSYPIARRPRRGAGNYHQGKPTLQWRNRDKMSELKQQNRKGLSEVATEKLRKNAESRQNDGKYVKLASGEKKAFKFDPEGIDQVVVEFNGKKLQGTSILWSNKGPLMDSSDILLSESGHLKK